MLVASASSAAPYRPSEDATVLVTVPPAAASTQTAFRTAQNALAANPNDLDLALEVARAAIRDGRASADPRRYGQAQAALAPWWSIPNPPMSVRVLRAIVRQSLHDFAGAEADLEAILRLDPRNGQARLTRAFVRQRLALSPTRRMIVAGFLRRWCARRRRLLAARAALRGSPASALERLDQVIKIYGKVDPLVLRWAQAVGADMAAMLGQTEAADLHFSEATTDGGDIPTLVAFADHLLDSNRPAEVLTLLAGRSEADIVYLRLAIAGKRLDDARAPHWTALLADRFAAANAGGVQLHLREEARFELEVRGDAATALKLALANWKIQKEPSDARLVLQTALAANDPAAAADVLAFIEKTGLADTRIKPLQDKIAEKKS